MIQIAPFEEHVKEYEAWFEKYPYVFQSELIAIKEQFNYLPENIKGIEVGVGTARFSEPLGIKEGVDPSETMREIALKKGIEVRDAKAEMLPYKDLQFDFVLFVTICHLENVKAAFKEAHRVLKNDGSLLIGFIDKNRDLGQAYLKKQKESTFYKHANFYSVEQVTSLLKDAGFKNLHFSQTLFDNIDLINEVEIPQEGTGKGAFVVVRASKKV